MNNQTPENFLADLMMDVVPKAMQSIRQEMRRERGERLTLTQFRMLASVRQGIASNKELGEKLGVSEAAVSRMIDLLVQEELISKITSTDDRRNKMLSLTTEGEDLYQQIRASAKGSLTIKLEAMDDKDREAVIYGLQVLQKNLGILKQ